MSTEPRSGSSAFSDDPWASNESRIKPAPLASIAPAEPYTSSSLDDPWARRSGFSDTADTDNHTVQTSHITQSFQYGQKPQRQYEDHVEESSERQAIRLTLRDLQVRQCPTRAGFLIKHTVYDLPHLPHLNNLPTPGAPICRRYSSFNRLNSYLVERHPLHILPQLPPKHMSLSHPVPIPGSDLNFLELRRRALSRYIRVLAMDEKLLQDEVVRNFLTAPADWDSWYTSNKKILDSKTVDGPSLNFIPIPQDLDGLLSQLSGQLERELPSVTNLIRSFERKIKLDELLAASYDQVNALLDPALWKSDSLRTICDCLQSSGKTQRDRAQFELDIVLEELKMLRDTLHSQLDLVTRFKDLSGNLKSSLMSAEQLLHSQQSTSTLAESANDGSKRQNDSTAAALSEVNHLRKMLATAESMVWHECERIRGMQGREGMLTRIMQEWAADQKRSSGQVADAWNAVSGSSHAVVGTSSNDQEDLT